MNLSFEFSFAITLVLMTVATDGRPTQAVDPSVSSPHRTYSFYDQLSSPMSNEPSGSSTLGYSQTTLNSPTTPSTLRLTL